MEKNEILKQLDYMTDCTLATLEGFLEKSMPPKGETKRHMAIAEVGIRTLNTCQYDARSRAADIVKVWQEHSQLSKAIAVWAFEQHKLYNPKTVLDLSWFR